MMISFGRTLLYVGLKLNVGKRFNFKKMSTHNVVAVLQLNCTHDIDENFKISEQLIRKSKSISPSVKMIFLPECFDYIGRSTEESVANAMEENGPFINKFRSLAKELNVWLSLGGFHEKSEVVGKTINSHLILNCAGETVAKYKKLHLFDVDIKNKVRVKETDFTVPGEKILPPVDTPIGKLGLSTCYDLRFPEMSTILRANGAQILTYPSAFTLVTGLAHWEILLRAQAITNQCYVIAAAQTGKHNEKRTSYGHAMIVDPWGTVVAQCSEGNNVCFGEIDFSYLNTVREQLPCYGHKRRDLYTMLTLGDNFLDPDSSPDYVFGKNKIPSSHVFLRTASSYAFVNRKPVVPGHVLIASLEKKQRFTDLTHSEVADIFMCVQKVQKEFEKFFKVKASTIAIQDGPDAGQTVDHVHVHVLPRRGKDFEDNDDVYFALSHHDKTEDGFRKPDVMVNEAKMFRKLFYSA